jgi:uncharacterized protein
MKSYFVYTFVALASALFFSSCTKENNAERSTHVNNPVVYFEIPVDDIDRASAFYEKVLGYKLERVAIDGNEMAMFPNDDDGSGISGALAKGDSYVPGKQGARVYFKASNIDEILSKAVAAGGKVAYPKTSIGDLGWVAEFEDSEGNVIALHAD